MAGADTGTDTGGGVFPNGGFADCRESALARLQTRHGPLVVEGVEHFIVVHDLGLVLRDGVYHVQGTAVNHGLLEELPLEHIRPDMAGDVRALYGLSVMTDDAVLHLDKIGSLFPGFVDA